MDPREELLASLREPHLPEVSWWPPAPGWWLLGLGLIAAGVGLTVVIMRYLRARKARYRANAWRRAALSELQSLRERLRADEAPSGLLGEASVLLRRAMLAVSEREEVAALQGQAWLQALDAMSGDTRFTRGRASLLAMAPYQRAPQCSTEELAEVFDTMEGLFTVAGSSSAGVSAS